MHLPFWHENILFCLFSNSLRSSSQRGMDMYILNVLLPFLKAKQDGSRSKRCNPLFRFISGEGEREEKKLKKFSCVKRSNTQSVRRRKWSLWSFMILGIQFVDSPHWQRWPRPPLHRFCSTGSVPTSPGCWSDTAPPPGQHSDKVHRQTVCKL